MQDSLQPIFHIVEKLQQIRQIPQFIFISPILPQSTIILREKILSFREEHPEAQEIDFIIESPGGRADDAYRIIRTLRKNFKVVNIIIPFWAKSAATLLSLGGSKIIMDEFGEFGPLDTQLKNEKDEMPDSETQSALLDEHSLDRIEKRSQQLYHSMFIELLASKDVKIPKSKLSEQLFAYVASFYKPLLEEINPYEIGAKARYLAIGERYAERILIQFNKVNKKDRDVFIDYIVHDCPDHGYIIDYDLISKFLPNVIKSSEIEGDYCKTLTILSNLFIKSDIDYFYIGFYDKKLLIAEKPKEVHNGNTNAENKEQKAPEKEVKPNGRSAKYK